MAGAGYKLFTTGQVLTAAEVNTYLQEQTVMVFNDAASRTTALSGVLAEGMVSYLKSTKVVEIYNGTAWASLDDPNAIQNTIVDAKGDLISASGNDVPARIAVGNNGETLVADSSTSTGLRWQSPVNSNPVLNSSFQIWQRGTTISYNNEGKYSADRWNASIGQSAASISRQITNDSTNLPFIQYCARIQRTAGNTQTNEMQFAQSFESINSIPYAGRTVTLSFYARAGANYSASSNALQYRLVTGTGTDQSVLSGFTSQANAILGTATLTTTWQRFSATVTLGATITQLAINFVFTPTGTAGASDFYEVTGVQLELGSVATPFKTYGGTLAGELAAAMRYYQKSYEQATAPATNNAAAAHTIISGNVTNGSWFGYIPFRVPMRTSPTVTGYSYANSTVNTVSGLTSGTDVATNSGTVEGANYQGFRIYNNSGGTVNSAGGGFIFHWVASAEL